MAEPNSAAPVKFRPDPTTATRIVGTTARAVGHWLDKPALVYHIGAHPRHNENQDSFWPQGEVALSKLDLIIGGRLYVVADGVSGGLQPDKASRLAARVIGERYYEQIEARELSFNPDLEASPNPALESLKVVLQKAVCDAHQMLVERSDEWREEHISEASDSAYMQSTCVCVVVRGNQLMTAHVGDSRAYLWRRDRLLPITEDHVSETGNPSLLLGAELTQDMVTVVAGAGLTVKIGSERLEDGDVLLICSDGLYKFVPEEEINNALSLCGGNLAAAARRLEAAALQAQQISSDNITALLLPVITGALETPSVPRGQEVAGWQEELEWAEEQAWWAPLRFDGTHLAYRKLGELYAHNALLGLTARQDPNEVLPYLTAARRLGNTAAHALENDLRRAMEDASGKDQRPVPIDEVYRIYLNHPGIPFLETWALEKHLAGAYACTRSAISPSNGWQPSVPKPAFTAQPKPAPSPEQSAVIYLGRVWSLLAALPPGAPARVAAEELRAYLLSLEIPRSFGAVTRSDPLLFQIMKQPATIEAFAKGSDWLERAFPTLGQGPADSWQMAQLAWQTMLKLDLAPQQHRALTRQFAGLTLAHALAVARSGRADDYEQGKAILEIGREQLGADAWPEFNLLATLLDDMVVFARYEAEVVARPRGLQRERLERMARIAAQLRGSVVALHAASWPDLTQREWSPASGQGGPLGPSLALHAALFSTPVSVEDVERWVHEREQIEQLFARYDRDFGGHATPSARQVEQLRSLLWEQPSRLALYPRTAELRATLQQRAASLARSGKSGRAARWSLFRHDRAGMGRGPNATRNWSKAAPCPECGATAGPLPFCLACGKELPDPVLSDLLRKLPASLSVAAMPATHSIQTRRSLPAPTPEAANEAAAPVQRRLSGAPLPSAAPGQPARGKEGSRPPGSVLRRVGSYVLLFVCVLGVGLILRASISHNQGSAGQLPPAGAITDVPTRQLAGVTIEPTESAPQTASPSTSERPQGAGVILAEITETAQAAPTRRVASAPPTQVPATPVPLPTATVITSDALRLSERGIAIGDKTATSDEVTLNAVLEVRGPVQRAQLRLKLPPGWEVVTPGWDATDGIATLMLQDLQQNSTRAVQVIVKAVELYPSAKPVYSFDMEVALPGDDQPLGKNARVSWQAELSPEPQMQAEMQFVPARAALNDIVTCTLTITNVGKVAADALNVAITLPNPLRLADPPPGLITNKDGRIEFQMVTPNAQARTIGPVVFNLLVTDGRPDLLKPALEVQSRAQTGNPFLPVQLEPRGALEIYIQGIVDWDAVHLRADSNMRSKDLGVIYKDSLVAVLGQNASHDWWYVRPLSGQGIKPGQGSAWVYSGAIFVDPLLQTFIPERGAQ